MWRKISIIPILALMVFSILAMDSPKKKNQPLALIGSDSATLQEDTGYAALGHPVVVANTSNQPVSVEFSTTVKCCSSGNGVSSNFTVTVRFDGSSIKTQNYSLSDMGYNYTYVPISWTIPITTPGNATHTFDVFVDSGGTMVVIFSSPTAPTFMNVYQ